MMESLKTVLFDILQQLNTKNNIKLLVLHIQKVLFKVQLYFIWLTVPCVVYYPVPGI